MIHVVLKHRMYVLDLPGSLVSRMFFLRLLSWISSRVGCPVAFHSRAEEPQSNIAPCILRCILAQYMATEYRSLFGAQTVNCTLHWCLVEMPNVPMRWRKSDIVVWIFWRLASNFSVTDGVSQALQWHAEHLHNLCHHYLRISFNLSSRWCDIVSVV